jgi:hypothetical protein
VTRLVVGNLDAEIEMARAATPGPHPDVSQAARQRIAAAARHLAVFAREGDRLWVPGDPEPDPADDVLAWAETESVARLRRSGATAPSPAVVRTVNHRRFAFELAQQHGWCLPGARIVRDVAEIELPAPWVAKASYSAAGRERVRHLGGALPHARLERLLARFGELLVEPWTERVVDLGCSGIVTGDDVRVHAPHRMDNDAGGVFRAAIIDDGAADWPDERAALRATAEIAGQALARAGYRGPFTVDGYVHASGLQRMSEINARLSFGLVARVAAERADRPGGPFELRL